MDDEHNGMVLFFEPTESPDTIVAIVLDLDLLSQSNQPVLKRISPEAFKVPDDVKLSEKKREQRKRSAPLCYGQQIKWKAADFTRGLIQKFERTRSCFTTRIANGEGQILVEGAVNPARLNDFYTHYFKYLQIPPVQRGHAVPNVYVEVWIGANVIHVDGNYELDLHFDSYESICPVEKQMEICLFPWNQQNIYTRDFSAFTNMSDNDAYYNRDDDNIVQVQPEIKIDKYTKDAYCTGPRKFMLVDDRMVRCVTGLEKYWHSLTIGEKYRINCFWSEVQECYVMFGISHSYGREENLKVDAETGLISCEATRNPRLRGFFHCDEYGLADDPFGILAMLYLTKYKNKPIPVSLLDRLPSRHGQMRFSIRGFADKFKEKSYNEWISTHKVTDASGVVIENGIAVSAEHVPILFKFPKRSVSIRLGTHVTFNAAFNQSKQRFRINKYREDHERDVIPVQNLQLPESVDPYQRTHTVYGVSVHMATLDHDSSMLYCDEFGLVDDPADLVNVRPNIIYYDVWVKLSTEHDSYVYPPRTLFHIVALRHDEKAKEKVDKATSPIKKRPTGFPPAGPAPPRGNRKLRLNFSQSQKSNVSTKEELGGEKKEEKPPIVNRPAPAITVGSNNTKHPIVGGAAAASAEITHSPTGVAENPMIDDGRRRYTGPVAAAPNEEGHRYNILETIKRLKHDIPHGEKCGDICQRNCPFIKTLSNLFVNAKHFHDEMQSRHPDLYKQVIEEINNVASKSE